MVMNFIRYFYKILILNYRRLFKINTIKYWQKRAEKHGSRAVFNIGHGGDEFEKVTEFQKSFLFPLLKTELIGNEQIILDFGCGPGRFTSDLATLVNGKCIGVDPIEIFIKSAEKTSQLTDFIVINNGKLPIKTESIDILWVCLVLGGITSNRELKSTIHEFNRVLRKGGLIFLVENVSQKQSGNHWIFRDVAKYKKLFSEICILEQKDYYFDLEEKISVMAGRKA